MLKANWSYPTEIRFGIGRIKELGNICIEIGIKKPLFVTDQKLINMNLTKDAFESIEKSRIEINIYKDIQKSPNEKDLFRGINIFNEGGCDGIIAFGGGSSIDLGKLIGFMARQEKTVWSFEDKPKNPVQNQIMEIPPIVAVPTTAGTGSEVSRAAILVNSKTKYKKIIFHPNMIPKIVICDPQLTISMPRLLTIGTGMDAFTHCLEAYFANTFHPISEGIALEGMRIIKENLHKTLADTNDLEARTNMMAAACMGAISFQKGLGAIHAISHAIEGIYKTHHGMTNAILMPYVLKLNQKAITTKVNNLSNYLKIQGSFDEFFEFIKEFLHSLEVPEKLSSLGVKIDYIDDIVEMALSDPSVLTNPVKLTQKNVKELLLQTI